MIESKKKFIGRYEYTVTQLTAKTGRAAFLKMAKLAAPIIGAGIAAGVKKEADANVTATLQNVAQSISVEDFEWFCDVFAKTTTVQLASNQNPQLSGIFDIHFAGHYFEMCSWLGFCLEVNFGSFLSELGSALGAGKEAAPAAAKE